MKTCLATLLVLFSSLSWADVPIEKTVPVDHVYVPHGFDSNDSAEIIVSGFLPNLCHKTPMMSYNIEGDTILIDVKALHSDPTNPFCAQVIIPFFESVKIKAGDLAMGDYKIVVNNGSMESAINIAAPNGPDQDDQPYANVEFVDIPAKGRVVMLKGVKTSSCLEPAGAPEVHNNGRDTFAILPIMKPIAKDAKCEPTNEEFSYPVTIPANVLKANRVLLHVRRLGGRSINIMFDNTRL